MPFFDRKKMLLAGLFAIFFISAINARGNAQLPKPDTESVNQAVKDIREAYAQDYKDADQKTQKKINLATKLNAVAEEETDAAVQFALLKEAISLQAAAQDAEALIDTTDTMSQRFKIDGLKIKVHFLKKIAGDTKKKSSDGRTVDAMRTVVNQAIANDEYDKALELLIAVTTMGDRTKDRKLVREYEKLVEKTRGESNQFRSVHNAQEMLEEKPLDAEANQTVGEWFCLKKGRWEEGVTYLALGNHSEMKELSRLDLKVKKTPDDEMRLGDLCWDLAQQMPDDRDALKNRAVLWYEKAQPALSGVTEKKIASRIESWQSETEPSTEDKETKGEKPRLAKRSKPLTKVKPEKWDAPKNLAGTPLWSRTGRVVMGAGQPPIQTPGKNNLYLHPYTRPGRSVLVFDLDGRYRSFTGGVGVPEIPGSRRPESEITFSVIRDGDETEIAETARRGKRSFKPFAIDVTGVKQLVLTTQCEGNFLGCFAFWFNPMLSPEEVKPLENSDEER